MHAAAEPCLPLPEFRELIDKKAKWQVDQFLFGRENGERPALQIKRFIEGIISADYHGRTLIELIQNAHDAHDKDAVDGQIRVVLDETEGQFGTLYVANGGHPLTDGNFASMIDVAVSDKPPSEGIGNKGVGFKSVLQFSECPEVYSRSSADGTEFDGFTFRFGTHDDFIDLAARWAPQEDGLASELANNVSTLTLTFPLASTPQLTTELGDAGFCTVIRLPLKSEHALEDARGELEAVADSDVPMHLFLDRIETIDLITIGPNGEARVSLTRLVEDIDRTRGLTRSLLQDDSEFIVARRTVPESAVLGAIKATRDAGAHLPGWDQWEGDAEVVLALAARDPLDTPRLYNFMPMGDRVECPLPAYLQAPFFSSLDRRSLDETYPINELFLDEAAALAADLLLAASAGDVELPSGTLVDLGCWSKGHLSRLVATLEERSCPLDGVAFLPSREVAGSSRVSVVDGSLWDVTGQHFTPERLEPEHLRRLIDPALGTTRTTRLEDLYRNLGHAATWRTGSDALVAFAETCAARLQSTDASPEEWAEFYDELAASLPRSATLAGARIVAGVGHLLPANGTLGSLTVFFPPQRGDTESRMQPPDAVAHQLAYVRDDIPWRLVGDQSYRQGRQWLSKYVADFGSEEILRVVAEVMSQQDLSEADLDASLRYALDVWRNARSPLAEEYFRAIRFRVPSVSGWVAADESYFGKGWGGADAWVDEALVRFVEALGDDVDLDGAADSILKPPSDWVPEEDLKAMREFLERAGARHGLWPIEIESGRWMVSGSTLNSPTSFPSYDLPAWVPTDLREIWLQVADDRPGRPAAYTTVEYRLVHVARLPGQSEWANLPTRAQEIYGELVLAGLDRWDDRDLEARFERQQSGDVATWPSPIVAFLTTSSWFPQREPGDRTTVTLTPIADAWWVEGDAPPYLPAPSPHLRRSVGSRAIERLRSLGARQWDAEDSAVARIEYLADLISQDGAWVRGTRAEYERSWTDFLGGPQAIHPQGVLVERSGAVELTNIAEDGETIYYAVPDDPKAALLAQLPLPRLGFRDIALSRRVGRYVSEVTPNRFRSIADAEIKPDWPEPTSQGPLLDMLGDWFETLVHLVLSHQQGVRSRGSRQLEHAVHRLRTTSLLAVDKFSTSVDGHPVRDPQALSCWVEGDDGRGVVLVRQAQGLTGIDLAERAAEGIVQAVGAPAVFKDLRLALVDLREAVRGGIPSNADLATALRLPETDVELARAERGAVRPDTSTLVALLATLAPDVAEELRDAQDIPTDRREMQEWLDSRLSRTAIDAAAVLSYEERGWTTGPIEEGLVSVKEANEGLRTLGLESVANTQVQVREFEAFVVARKSGLIDELRDRFSSEVADDPTALTSYAAVLELPNLAHDPVWADVFWRVPDDEMAERVERWLIDVAGPSVVRTLPSVGDLRDRQRQSMTSSLTTARDSVLTWCELNDVAAPPAIDVASVSAQMRSCGYLDFGERTSDDFVAWLAARGYWPDAMPQTLNQRALNITQEDLREARGRKHREAEETRRREAAITFEGQEYTGDPDDLLKLDEAIAVTLTDADFGATPKPEKLKELRSAMLSGSGRDRKSRSIKPTRAASLPPGKIENIGLVGEIVAGHWIASNFGLPREETWRSGCRNDIIGDELGDDSLGYDFEVLAGDLTYLIEVKATMGDDTSFRLPESEIRRALNLAPHERYMILFISNVLDTQLRHFRWLPNPLGPDARLFSVEGRAMKFRFNVHSDEDP